MASVAAKQAPSDLTSAPRAPDAAVPAVGDTREIRELRLLLQKSQVGLSWPFSARYNCEPSLQVWAIPQVGMSGP